jgi:hypothetical protein
MKRQFIVIAITLAVVSLLVTARVQAQTKITKPSGGLPFKINSSGSYFSWRKSDGHNQNYNGYHHQS